MLLKIYYENYFLETVHRKPSFIVAFLKRLYKDDEVK